MGLLHQPVFASPLSPQYSLKAGSRSPRRPKRETKKPPIGQSRPGATSNASTRYAILSSQRCAPQQASLRAGAFLPPPFFLQQPSASLPFFEVGQQGLPQSSPQLQPVQSQALHSQLVHLPFAQPHSLQSQSLPQQHAATAAEAGSPATPGNTNSVAAAAMASPLIRFIKNDIFISSLRRFPQ